MKLITIFLLSCIISTAPNIRLPLCDNRIEIIRESGNDFIRQERNKILKARNWGFNWYFEYIEVVLNS